MHTTFIQTARTRTWTECACVVALCSLHYSALHISLPKLLQGANLTCSCLVLVLKAGRSRERNDFDCDGCLEFGQAATGALKTTPLQKKCSILTRHKKAPINCRDRTRRL